MIEAISLNSKVPPWARDAIHKSETFADPFACPFVGVHRLGQKKETRVFRLVMDNSIEESTIEIQKEKRKLMLLAFSERAGKRDQVKQGRLADIQRLLGAAGPSKERDERVGPTEEGSPGPTTVKPKPRSKKSTSKASS